MALWKLAAQWCKLLLTAYMFLKLPFLAFSGFVLFDLISRYQEESGCNKGSKGLKWPKWPKKA